MTVMVRRSLDDDFLSAETAVADTTVALDPSGAAWLPDTRTLVVSDLHLEKGSSFARRGVFLPPYDTRATLLALAAVVARHDPHTIVSLGDSFHDDEGASRLTPCSLELLANIARGRSVFWIAGNHDPSPPAAVPGDAVAELAVGGLTFRHIPGQGAVGEVAGHLHPAARIVRRGRSVRRACFATDGRRMVMPAFGVFTGGMNVLDPVCRGYFVRESLRAFMIGNGRIFPIDGRHLCP